MKGLNPKQRRFVDEYLVDLNATKAAERAGYKARSAYSIGQENLTKPEIAAAIQAEQDARAQRVQVRADEVLRELVAIVKTNPSHFVLDDAGYPITRDENDTESWRAVASVKQKTKFIPQKDGEPIIERETELKFWDKNSAIDKAMRHLGILTERVDVRTETVPPFTFRIDSASGDGDN